LPHIIAKVLAIKPGRYSHNVIKARKMRPMSVAALTSLMRESETTKHMKAVVL
jgi:hypothetical protein